MGEPEVSGLWRSLRTLARRVAARPATRVAERVHSGGSSGPLRLWIGDQLRAIGKQRSAELRSGTRGLANDKQADAFLRPTRSLSWSASCASSGAPAPGEHGKCRGGSDSNSAT
jgi:hypothetical protein